MKEKQHAQIMEISEEVKWMSHMIGSVDWNFVAQQKGGDRILKRMQQEKNRTIFTSKYFTVSYETSEMPIWTKNVEGKNLTLIFHGRLYNKQQLKNELLANGYTFETNSDMEIVFYSYVEWGKKSLEKLNGAYVFALWNEQDEQLLLVRDRLGIKRLFYKIETDRLFFSTDFQLLVEIGQHRPHWHEEGIAHALAFGSVRSFYNGIYEVNPAYVFFYDRKGVTSYCYWKLMSKQHVTSINDTADEIRNLLVDKVEKELAEEKNINTIISPNIASYILIALGNNVVDQLRTYSFCALNKNMIDYLKLIRTEYITATFSREKRKKIMAEWSILDDSFITVDLYEHILLQQMTKNETAPILTALGIDEIFATCNQNDNEKHELSILQTVREKEKYLHDHWRKKIKLFDYVVSKYEETVHRTPLLTTENKKDSKQRQFSYLVLQWKLLPLLQRIEKSYEKVHKKVYVPYADYRFIEYVWNVPQEMKQLGGYDKGILRKAFEGIVLAQLLYEKRKNDSVRYHFFDEQLVIEKMKALLVQNDSPLFYLFDQKKMHELICLDKKETENVHKINTMIDFIQLEAWFKQNFSF